MLTRPEKINKNVIRLSNDMSVLAIAYPLRMRNMNDDVSSVQDRQQQKRQRQLEIQETINFCDN